LLMISCSHEAFFWIGMWERESCISCSCLICQLVFSPNQCLNGTAPDDGLKFYDINPGGGPVAEKGETVVVCFWFFHPFDSLEVCLIESWVLIFKSGSWVWSIILGTWIRIEVVSPS
jgi:hypothetical protein